MGKQVEKPKKHIVSVRLTAEEVAVFNALQKRSGCDRSRLLRMAVDEFIQAARELGVKV